MCQRPDARFQSACNLWYNKPVVLNVVDSLILEKISCCDNDRRIYAFQSHLALSTIMEFLWLTLKLLQDK